MKRIVLSAVLEFNWDEGNSSKSWIKHKVSKEEQEQAFFVKEKIIVEDKKHSELEARFLLYSKTNKGKKIIIAFTIRTLEQQQKIRPISARGMNKRELALYKKAKKGGEII